MLVRLEMHSDCTAASVVNLLLLNLWDWDLTGIQWHFMVVHDSLW